MNQLCMLALFLLYLGLSTASLEYSVEDKLMAEIEITDLELQDDCENLANGIRSSLLNRNFREKITVEQAHGRLMKSQSENLKSYQDVPYSVLRNWTLLTLSGDTLLQEEDWNKLVSYYNANEELSNVAKVPCANGKPGCTFGKDEYRNILETSKDPELLKSTWSKWQEVLLSSKDQYPSILQLVEKAAILNGKDNAKAYWEMLVEKEDAYSQADRMWKEIEPLYLKLHEFVKTRLFNYYNLTEEDNNNSTNIPVYLLGPDFGEDWSHVAHIVLPHPQLHYDAENYLKTKSLKDVFKIAEKLTEQLSLGTLGKQFWAKSIFNMTSCDNNVLSFCTTGYSEILTCDTSSWTRYLDTHETAIDICLRNEDYTSLSRLNLRYSPLNDALITLGSTLALENLHSNGVLDEIYFSNQPEKNETLKMSKLLLLALRLLPRLPFYLVADRWRLDELDRGKFDNMSRNWWELRNDLQKVDGVSNQEYDFLADHRMISNKPYLSKFLGIILHFQILEYYKNQMVETHGNLATEIGKDENFLQIIHERSTNDWGYLTNFYYGIYDVSTGAILEYFKPLEKYLSSAPLEQVAVVSTTRRPTTTTTSATTTTEKIAKKIQEIGSEAGKVPGNLSEAKSLNSSKLAESEAAKNSNLTDDILSKPLPPAMQEENDNSTVKSDSSSKQKSAGPPIEITYVGIAVGVSLVIILITVILKRKCKRRKLPHNRRFET